MAEAKEFHIGDVLSVTTGRLVSPRHIEGVYDILNHMTGESVYTHQIPRICQEAEPVLLAQHPFLADIEVPEAFTGEAHVKEWLAAIVATHGETLPVVPMTKDEHEYREPVSELAEMVHPDKIVTVRL